MAVHYLKIPLPLIADIKWRRDGYGTQVINLDCTGYCPGGGHVGPRGEGGAMAPSVGDRIQRGYVKVWYRHPEPHVIDRALTTKVARKRIAQHKRGQLL